MRLLGSVAQTLPEDVMKPAPRDNFMSLILRQPRLSRSEERDLLLRLRRGDEEAATKLVTSHLRFVLHIARRYRSQGHSLADLIQEGTVGLMEAVKRFNPERNVRLSTYSMWWIRAAIQDYVIRSRSLVRMGTTAAQRSLFLNLRRAMAQRLDGERVSEDISRWFASRFDMSVSDVVAFARRIARPDQSLDTPIAESTAVSSATSPLERLIDDRPTPEDRLLAANERRLWRRNLIAALKSLPPRELLIIKRRFLAERAPSRRALAAELGLSKERVRQLEVRALGRMKTLLEPLRDNVAGHGDTATA
jgi:RNA polymerase sigma-32 factor